MPVGCLAAFLLGPASGCLRNESEHVQRGLVRVAGSPELAQLCFSRAAAGRGQLCQAGDRGAGSPEPPWVCVGGCFVPGTRLVVDLQWVKGAGLCHHSWCDPSMPETSVGAEQVWPGHLQGARGRQVWASARSRFRSCRLVLSPATAPQAGGAKLNLSRRPTRQGSLPLCLPCVYSLQSAFFVQREDVLSLGILNCKLIVLLCPFSCSSRCPAQVVCPSHRWLSPEHTGQQHSSLPLLIRAKHRGSLCASRGGPGACTPVATT